VGVWSGTVRLSDFLYLSFVFIDILALFPQNQVESRGSRSDKPSASNPAPLDLVSQLLNFLTAELLDSLFS
jgi:hypothetical protein